MFVQVIEGRVTAADDVRRAMERWMQDISGDAIGWLGTTAGVTDDGRFLALARFESEEAARRNSDRPEQDKWWQETSGLFDGEATFRDSSDIDADTSGGDPDQAGFVQVIQGRTSDPQRVRTMMQQDQDQWASFRPDIIATLSVNHDEGAYTVAIYFTSEAEAREHERQEPPPELKQQMDEMNALEVGEPTFHDLRDPWLYSPG